MKVLLRAVTALVVLGLLYLFFWPVAVDPVAWNPPEAPTRTGPYAVNQALASVERLGDGVGPKPEDVAIDQVGRIYAGFEDGRIMRWATDGTSPALFVDTGGRPLGLHFDASQHLVVADSYRGLLRVSPEGELTVLSTGHAGLPYGFANDVDVAGDGTIYFTDASHKFGQTEFTADLMEHRPNGRLLAYDPVRDETTLLLDELYFANGVAADPGGQFLLVNETGAYRVRKYWLKGERNGDDEVLIQNLPGFPDGISTGTGGVYWLALASPRNALMDTLGPWPFLRKMVMRLPSAFRPKPVQYAFVLGIGDGGDVLHNLQDPDGAYAPVTSVQEHDGYLYFGSIIESALARIPVPDRAPQEGVTPGQDARGTLNR